MSDQNPPTSPGPSEPEEPTPTPAAEPTPSPAEEPADEAPAAETSAGALPPEEKKSGRGRLLAIIAAVVVLVLVVGGLVAFFALRTTSHKLTTPATAGSMKRDTAREKQLSTELTQAKEQFKTQGQGKGSTISYVKSAVYNQKDAKRGPAGALVFLGAKLSKDQSPAKWVSQKFTKQAKTNGLKITTIDPGDSGTKAVCASVATPQKVAICAWATHDTIGELVPTVAGYDAKTLAKIMLALRKDVEQSE
jgi:hypothetical protein